MTDPIRLAVLGDPLAYTRSPILHRAGLEHLGYPGTSEALCTPAAALKERLAALATAGYRGVNLTHPLKHAVLVHLERIADRARMAQSVNTVGFGPGPHWGDSTDGEGFLDWLLVLGRDPARERVLLLGAGGAARSLALALGDAGASVAVAARRPTEATRTWAGLPARVIAWSPEPLDQELAHSTLVVNATPVSAAAVPLDPAQLPARAMAVDLTYGEELTPWVRAGRSHGIEAWDGLGLLTAQARRSLALWLDANVPFDVLARAVGWPR